LIAFVRHGQTAANEAGRLQGRIDPDLTELGRVQAARLGDHFATQPVTRVIASPLRRAIETATPIADAHGLAVEADPRLVELDYGEWDARGLSDVDPDEWARWRADPTFTPPGGESLVDVGARVQSFCDEHVDEPLLVAVSHVSPIKAAACWALGVDTLATWRMFLDLASITRVGRRGEGPGYLVSFNEVVPGITRR
jgi:broad specificity phosphatase PhoE